MAEFGVGFKVFADASQFQREMRGAVESSKQVQRGLRDIGLNIGRFVGVTAVGSWFVGTARAAQELRDEIQKVGGTVDGATARVAAFGDGLDEIKKTAVGMSITVLGFFNKMGDVLAYLPNRLTGVSKANEETAQKIAADTEAALARIAKAREANSPEKLAAAEKALQSERRKNALENVSAAERINMLQADSARIESERDALAVNTVSRKEKELELEKVTAEIRKAEQARSKEVLAAIDSQRKQATDDEEKLKDLGEQRAKIAAELADQAEREAAAKSKQLEVTATLKKLNDDAYADAVFFLVNSTLDKGMVQSASDSALKEVQRRKQNELLGLGVGGGGVTFDDKYYQRLRIQNEISQVRAELGMRQGLQTDVAQRGIEGARRAFTGDPLVFDKLVQQFVQDSRTAQELQAKTLTLLERMDQRAKSPQPVVVMNTNQYGIR